MRAGPHRAARDASCHSVALVELLCRRAVHEYALCAMLALGSEAPRVTRARVCAALVGRVRVCRPSQRGRRKGTWRAQARQDAAFNPFRTRVGSSQQSTPSAPRAGTGRAIATVNAERIDLAASQARAYHIFVHAQCGPRHGPFQWSHEHRGVEMHRRDDNRSPWRHNGDATRWRHQVDA